MVWCRMLRMDILEKIVNKKAGFLFCAQVLLSTRKNKYGKRYMLIYNIVSFQLMLPRDASTLRLLLCMESCKHFDVNIKNNHGSC